MKEKILDDVVREKFLELTRQYDFFAEIRSISKEKLLLPIKDSNIYIDDTGTGSVCYRVGFEVSGICYDYKVVVHFKKSLEDITGSKLNDCRRLTLVVFEQVITKYQALIMAVNELLKENGNVYVFGAEHNCYRYRNEYELYIVYPQNNIIVSVDCDENPSKN